MARRMGGEAHPFKFAQFKLNALTCRAPGCGDHETKLLNWLFQDEANKSTSPGQRSAISFKIAESSFQSLASGNKRDCWSANTFSEPGTKSADMVMCRASHHLHNCCAFLVSHSDLLPPPPWLTYATAVAFSIQSEIEIPHELFANATRPKNAVCNSSSFMFFSSSEANQGPRVTTSSQTAPQPTLEASEKIP